MMSRIAFLIPDLGGGGAERVAVNLVNEFVERGHEVDLLVMQRTGPLSDDVSAAVRIVDLHARRTRNALWPLVRYLRDRRPDAMQVSLWPLTVVGIVAARLSRVPVRVVASDHTSLSQQYGHKPLVIRLLKLTTRWAYPMAGAVLSVSRGSADDLATLSGLAEDRISVVYNPVPERPVSPRAAEVARQWTADGPRILSAGTLKTQKDHALLIDSFARLPATLNASLVIAGDGELRDPLEQQVNTLGLQNRVTFAGYVDNLGDYYRAADLFVLSSSYEGFALVIVEALHAGLRIVSTDCPNGPAEILEGGRYGTLVPVGNSARLAEAIEATLKRRPAPEAQRGRARDFSTEAAADEYLRLMKLPLRLGGLRTDERGEAIAEPQLQRRRR